MKVKEVLAKYNKLVEFPWSPEKIKKAGYIPRQFILALGNQLSVCDDVNLPTTRKLCDTINKLKSE